MDFFQVTKGKNVCKLKRSYRKMSKSHLMYDLSKPVIRSAQGFSTTKKKPKKSSRGDSFMTSQEPRSSRGTHLCEVATFLCCCSLSECVWQSLFSCRFRWWASRSYHESNVHVMHTQHTVFDICKHMMRVEIEEKSFVLHKKLFPSRQGIIKQIGTGRSSVQSLTFCPAPTAAHRLHHCQCKKREEGQSSYLIRPLHSGPTWF